MGAELFKNIPSKVDDLVRGVRIGRIGLPDLQRPFVWADNKVRDLFDSMMKGYPIGYVMIWESPSDYETKKNVIGKNEKIHDEPKELVIDGQQRLTALVAAMYGVVVKDKNFADKEIKISFNPLTREFAVSGLRMVAGPKGKVIAAGKSGKFKTASTMVGLCVWMAFPGISFIGTIVMWMIVITTVYSGVEYFIQNWNVLWD